MGKRHSRHYRRTRSRPIIWLSAATAVVLLVAVVGITVAALRSGNLSAAQAQEVAEARDRIEQESAARAAADLAQRELLDRCLGAPTRDPDSGCMGVDLGDGLYPFDASNDAQPYCWTSAADQPLDSCAYGSTSPDALRIALVGDSHARHLMPGLEPEAEESNWAIQSFFGNGCALTTEPLDTCAAAGPQILHELTHGEPFDVVVVSVSRRKRVTEASVIDAVQQVQATGAKVVVMEDVPTTSAEAIGCYQAEDFDVKTSVCGVPTDGMKEDLLVQLAETTPGVGVGRIESWFCDSTFCPIVIGNTIVYSDEGAHMTATYSRSVGPYVAAAIRIAAGV